MADTIFGKKVGMTQIWTEDDKLIAVTVIEAGPCLVSQVKTTDTDGYEAIQVAYDDIKPKRVNRPMSGHYEKAGITPKRYLREIRLDDASNYNVGDEITVTGFENSTVNATSKSKGRGFAGVIKRYGFGGGPGGHGSHFHRIPGSIGQCASPSRVFKGKKLPGHMGDETVTVKNLDVVSVNEDLNLILVKGAIPGAKGSLVRLKKTAIQAARN